MACGFARLFLNACMCLFKAQGLTSAELCAVAHAIIRMTTLSCSQMLALHMSRHSRLGAESLLGSLNQDIWEKITKNILVHETDFEELTDVFQKLIAGAKMTYRFRIIIGNTEHTIGMKEMNILEDQIQDLENQMFMRTRYATMTLEKYVEEMRRQQKELDDDHDDRCAGMRADH
jgi:hypothetical protein